MEKTKKRNLATIIMILIVFVVAITGSVQANSKYSKYEGKWTLPSHDYGADLNIKKLSKNKIKGSISAAGYYYDEKNDKIVDFKDSAKFNKKIKMKNKKLHFKVKTKKGKKINVYVKLVKQTIDKKYDKRKGINVKIKMKKPTRSWRPLSDYGYRSFLKI